jgi:predicted permease
MGILVDALRRWWLRLRFYLFRARYDREMEEEMRHHLDLRTAEYAREGKSEAEARGAAIRRFGNRTFLQEQGRSAAGLASLETAGQDVRYVLRSLRASPGFTAMAVLTLGLGIGANAAMFGVIDRLLLRGPEHVVDPEQVVRVYSTERHDAGGEFTRSIVPYALYAEMRNVRAFDRVAAYAGGFGTTGRGREAQLILVARVTWDFFPLLGVRPAVGRFFRPEEDRPPQGEDVAVLDGGYWRRVFGGDPGVVGRTLEINGSRYRIVGAAPDGFAGGGTARADVWVPMSARAWSGHPEWPTTWDAYWVSVIGRLRPGVKAGQADAEATAVHRRAYTGRPEHTIARARLSVRPLRFNEVGREPAEVAVSRWLAGVAAVVLLVTCANAGNLVLARTLRRRREVAVRLALGITRARLVRLLLAESLVVSIAGGAAGLLLALAGGRFIGGVLLPGLAWNVDGRVLALTAVAALVTGLLVGLVPALQGSRPDLTTALKAGAREGAVQRSRLRTTLTVAQAALSVVLLVGAGLFVRSLWNVRSLRLGIEPDRVLAVDVASAWAVGVRPEATADQARAARLRDFYARALERVRAIPGVESASLAFGTPLQSTYTFHIAIPGWDSIPKLPGGEQYPYVSTVSVDYFRTVGTRLLRGRLFTPADVATGARVAVVNETMARTLWPGREPIGNCLMITPPAPCSHVIGVVEDARRFRLLGEDAAMQYYLPLGQNAEVAGATLLVRPARSPAAMAETVRRELQQLEPTVGYISVQALQAMIDPQIRPWRLGATMFVVFGALALLVAAIGLYSLIAYLVAQRTHEFGVRIALGARTAHIARLVMGRGVGAAAAGVAIGVGLALALGRLVEPLLFETSPRDASVLLTVTATLLTFAVLASLVPTWRAVRVDPVTALRSET